MRTLETAPRGRRRWILLLAAIALAVPFYHEFVADVDAAAAVAYFSQQPQLDDTDNAAFAYAGIVAPPASDSPRGWGYVEVIKNRERQRRGERRSRIVDDRPAEDDRLWLQLPAAGHQLVCWLPSARAARARSDCLDRGQMQALLERNRLALQRYRAMFDYPGLYFREQDDLGLTHAPTLSRLLAIDLWLRRDRLADDDIETLFRFFRFWENQARGSRLGLVGTTIAIVNYEIAASLLARLSELDPALLLRYREYYGDFIATPLGADDYDRLVRAEFRSINFEFCFVDRLGGESVSCARSGRNLYYKPGRTLALLYRQRLQPADCRVPARQQQVDPEAVDREFWKHVFRRPGNFRGRSIARLISGAMRKACVLLDGVDRLAQQNRLRNLYLYFQRRGYSPAQIEEHLASGETDPSIAWDADRRLLRWQPRDGQQRYDLFYSG